MVRFPGGCFADSYDWRDGIGPGRQSAATQELEFGWTLNHTFGGPPIVATTPTSSVTIRIRALLQIAGQPTIFAANLRSLPAEEFNRLGGIFQLARGQHGSGGRARRGGFMQPFDVRFWGVGNKAWGCGGNFTAAEYAAEFRRYTTWVPRYGQTLSFIGSGPNVDDWEWTRRIFEEIVRKGRGADPLRVRVGIASLRLELESRKDAGLGAGKGRCAEIRSRRLV